MNSSNHSFCRPQAGVVLVSAFAACAGLLPPETRADTSSTSLAIEPSLVLQVDGRNGWVVTDDPAPCLTWTSAVALPGVDAWRVILEREDAPGARREWTVPAADGPLKVIEDLPRVSRARYRWQVIPLAGSSQTAVEKAATGGRFEVGLLNAADWQGQWIGLDPAARGRAAVWFRKEFVVEKPVAQARLYVSGLGWHEAWLNGRKLGDAVLEPLQTDYKQRVFYVTHDVTEALRSGDNALGVWVGEGAFTQNLTEGKQGVSHGEPRMIAQLEIVYTDNSKVVVASDDSWCAAPSAVTASNINRGESFDARRYHPDWASPGFDSAEWPGASVVTPPGGTLVAEDLPPCRRMRRHAVPSWREVKFGTFIGDLGEKITGLVLLRVRAGPGTKVTLRYAESLDASGNVEPLGTDTYVSESAAEGVWETRFTYHTFRYVEFAYTNGFLDWDYPQPGPRTLEAISLSVELPAPSGLKAPAAP